jgi:hypothetical protein
MIPTTLSAHRVSPVSFSERRLRRSYFGLLRLDEQIVPVPKRLIARTNALYAPVGKLDSGFLTRYPS